MNISDVMTRKVDFIDPDLSLTEACQHMRDHDIGMLPIGEKDRLIGVITDRDICIRAIAEGRDPATARIRDCMTERVYYCYEDQSTREVLENLGEVQVRRMPVVNRDKRLVGIVALSNLCSREDATALEQAYERITRPSRPEVAA